MLEIIPIMFGALRFIECVGFMDEIVPVERPVQLPICKPHVDKIA
jgi:hypothetical protein